MDPSHIHEDITRFLYKIEEQYSKILHHKDRIPTLDVDLVLKDISTLYECFLDLRVITEHERNNVNVQPAEIPNPVSVVPKDLVSEGLENVEPVLAKEPETVVLSEPLIEAVSVEETSEIKEKTEAEKEPVIQSVDEPKEVVIAWQKTFDASKDKPEGINKPAPTPVSAGSAPIPPQVTAPKVDLLKQREKDFVPTVRKIEFRPEPTTPDAKKESIFDKAASLYDKIAKPAEKTVAVQAGKQPISNIKASIGVNEKFIYLKDLFRNNIGEYNEALDKLNNFESYSDAEDYFQELKSRYHWDSEGKSFHGLAELLNRRYLHNA